MPDKGKAEIVDGGLTLMSATVGLPGHAAGEVFASLREYARRTGHGHAFPDNVGFIVDLPRRQSFSPEAAFHTGKIAGMKVLEGRPCLR